MKTRLLVIIGFLLVSWYLPPTFAQYIGNANSSEYPYEERLGTSVSKFAQMNSSVDDVICGEGTELVNGACHVVKTKATGDCLIATASYGSELAPQVQFLREIRDNTVMSTSSGAAFMSGFNQLYYSFSPTIADMEREHPMFQETVRAFITPMISTLSIMTLADNGSEVDVLGLGISVIALNLGMYIAAPAVIVWQIKKRL